MDKIRQLKGKGEFDYDYLHDTLFFKVRDREYEKSIELNNFIVDIDDENFIVGVQIFDASKYFGIPKNYLRVAMSWKFQGRIEQISKSESRIEIRLMFQIKMRNKILQPTPIITQNVRDSLESSRMVCVPAPQQRSPR